MNWVNEPTKAFIARHGVHEVTTTILGADEVRDLVEKMLKSSGRRVDLSTPFIEANSRMGYVQQGSYLAMGRRAPRATVDARWGDRRAGRASESQKLVTYLTTKDEGEQARYTAYALSCRAAEATTDGFSQRPSPLRLVRPPRS